MLSNDTANKIYDWLMRKARDNEQYFDINILGFDLQDFEEFVDYAFNYMSLLK